MTVVFVVIFIAVVLVLISCIVIVPPGQAYIVERLGSFHAVYREGRHFRSPFTDRITAKLMLSEQTLVLDRERTLSEDGADMHYRAFVRYRIVDPERAHYNVSDLKRALTQLTRSAANTLIGHLSAGEASDSLEAVGKSIKNAVASGAEQWGLLVEDISFSELYQI